MNVVVAVIVCIDAEVDETDITGLVCSDDEVDSIGVVVTFGIKCISAFMYYSDIN